jgi:DNA adenine methylase
VNYPTRQGSRVIGAKSAMGAAQRIVSEMPPHELYIEAFAGSAAVGRLKRRSTLELYIERDPRTAAALREVMGDRQIVIGDCTRLLVPERIPGDAVLYADPPYLQSVRKSSKRCYRFELWTDAEHERLLSWLKRLSCRVLVSGYWSELYAARLDGWRLVTFTVPTRHGSALECLWLNFPEPAERHDTRFVGTDFRERERIKRKAARWARRIAEMPAAERAAVLAALNGPASTPPVPQMTMKACQGKVRTVSTPQLELL